MGIHRRAHSAVAGRAWSEVLAAERRAAGLVEIHRYFVGLLDSVYADNEKR
jgi:hypothetical protein